MSAYPINRALAYILYQIWELNIFANGSLCSKTNFLGSFVNFVMKFRITVLYLDYPLQINFLIRIKECTGFSQTPSSAHQVFRSVVSLNIWCRLMSLCYSISCRCKTIELIYTCVTHYVRFKQCEVITICICIWNIFMLLKG